MVVKLEAANSELDLISSGLRKLLLQDSLTVAEKFALFTTRDSFPIELLGIGNPFEEDTPKKAKIQSML